jgi:hypothetical protein
MTRVRNALLLATILLAGCGPFFDGVGGSSDEIADAVEAGKPFRLADVTGFDWDRFYAFGSYTTPDQIDKALGFHWEDAKHSDFVESDGGSLLVFVRDGEVVEAFDQDWGAGHFSCVDRREFTPEDASFRVRGENVLAADGRRSRSCSVE